MLDSSSQVAHSSEETAPKRVIGRPFQRGSSGNPAGRAKLPEDIKALARAKTKVAFERIVSLIDSQDERVAFMAAKEVIERAYGKPKQEDDPEGLNAKNVTINIVRLADHQPEQPKAIEAEAIVVRKLSADAND